MKIMFRKHIVLIVTLLVISGCGDSLKPPVLENPPAGEGYFSLIINEVNTGRTILPTTVQNNFLLYTLEFFPAGTTSDPINRTERNNSNLSTPIPLSAGTWDLYVIAYMDGAKTKPAAQGHLKNIKIGSGETVSNGITLAAIIDEGEGTFRWNINYPSGGISVTSASMTITPLAASGTPTMTLYFRGGTPQVAQSASRTLKAGYYRVVFNLSTTSGQLKTERRETLHIYKNMESAFVYTFTSDQFAASYTTVTSNADDGAGSLRQTIAEAPANSVIIIGNDVGTITLSSRLTISKNLVIEGNGVTITRNWTTGTTDSQLLYSTATVKISRILFKNGFAYTGAAIRNEGDLTLESCIFSGNQAFSEGGAIYNNYNGSMSIKGCTFYRNSAVNTTSYCIGGAISSTGTMLTLEGNLFFGNTANACPVVRNGTGDSEKVISNGYNVVDVPFGTGETQSGWIAGTGDKTATVIPISGKTFYLLSGSGAANVMPNLSVNYPVVDFYGNLINAPAAAGAVQTYTSGNGNFLGITWNVSPMVTDPIRGNVSVSSESDQDGLYPANTTLTATPADDRYFFAYWLVNGRKTTENPLVLNGHTVVHAIFGQRVTNFTVDDFTTGYLRYAINNAADGDVIRCFGVVPGQSYIALGSRLLIGGTNSILIKNITIEGMGITITQTDNWYDSTHPLLYIGLGGSITIERVHFKDGRQTNGGAAIRNYGILTLESCIFSGNISNGQGGAIYSSGARTPIIRGCTFYGNSANVGGAIWCGGPLLLVGNLFYGNTATQSNRVVYIQEGSAETYGSYNVVDEILGPGSTQSGWPAGTGDTIYIAIPFNVNTFIPITDLRFRIPSAPANFPLTDFYGNTRTYPGAPGAVKWE
jgi:predicted outer membrane repeat protein